MSQQIDKTNLGYMGESYQYKLVKQFMEDKSCFKDLEPLIDQNMFTGQYLRIYVGTMLEYFRKYGCVPTYSSMSAELRQKSHTQADIEFCDATIDKIRKTTSDGREQTISLATRFFRQQNIIKAANEAIRLAGNGDLEHFEECEKLLKDALNAGVHEDFEEVMLYDGIENVLSDDFRITIPTGIGKIDETLEGGLGKGELGVIIGPSGFGKSSMTTAMASHAACNGWKVLQIVFEDRIKQIQRKHLGRITGVEAKDLSKPDNIDLVKAAIENFPDKDKLNENLRIVKFPSGEKTARQLERFIKKLINSAFKPDLTIIDYFECLEHETDRTTSNEFSQEGKTMRRFEAMAGELDMAIWIPSQGTKDSINLELVTMDKIGGSVKKAQIAHVIMSIARTVDDIANNKATIAILKNRAGKSGKVFNNVEFNNGTCRISTDNVDELDSLFELKKKQEDIRLNTQKEIFMSVRNEKK